jgi:hypothetical protein
MFVYLRILGKGAVQESKKFSVACCVPVASRSQSSWMLCHVSGCVGTDVLEKHADPVWRSMLPQFGEECCPSLEKHAAPVFSVFAVSATCHPSKFGLLT